MGQIAVFSVGVPRALPPRRGAALVVVAQALHAQAVVRLLARGLMEAKRALAGLGGAQVARMLEAAQIGCRLDSYRFADLVRREPVAAAMQFGRRRAAHGHVTSDRS